MGSQYSFLKIRCNFFFPSRLISNENQHIYGILQARILEWIVMPSSRGSSQPRDPTHVCYVSCIGRWVLYP